LKRLVERAAVRSVFHDGRKRVSPFFTIFFLSRPERPLSYAIHIRKKFGIAVERNHAKRLLRAALYELRELLRGYQIILIPRSPMRSLGFWQIVRELEKAFSKPGAALKT